MLKDGDVIEIGGKEATVCFNTTYNNTNYICVAFMDDKLKFEIYDYKMEGEKLLVAKVEDPKEAEPLMKIFLEEGLNEVGLPEKFEGLFDDYN